MAFHGCPIDFSANFKNLAICMSLKPQDVPLSAITDQPTLHTFLAKSPVALGVSIPMHALRLLPVSSWSDSYTQRLRILLPEHHGNLSRCSVLVAPKVMECTTYPMTLSELVSEGSHLTWPKLHASPSLPDPHRLPSLHSQLWSTSQAGGSEVFPTPSGSLPKILPLSI